jgi:hypothetical protein
MNKKLTDYVKNMSPRVWTAIFRNNEEEAYRNGYDDAMRHAQRDLTKILEEDNS